MSEERSVFDSIMQGMEEAIAHVEGKDVGARVTEYSDMDIKAIRKKCHMSQSTFAQEFGFSVNTLKHWEQGNRKPAKSAMALLKIIDNDPEYALQALAR
ncbi:MAG: type II toxin-antitoxin system MqsA family antitoxin [Pseudomonadales bacterium]|nr:type II toxin-antitoxin system MqsA family antitoxin [Pseudomonadales bacterium]